MKSFTCHNLNCYFLVVLLCFFFIALLGCEEKVTPPAKPSVVKKRIEQDKTKTLAPGVEVLKDESEKVPVPSSEGTPIVEQAPETEPAPGKTITPETKIVVEKTPGEEVMPAKDKKDQTKAQISPGIEAEKSTVTEGATDEKNSSLIASIPDESWQYDSKDKIDPFAALFKEGGDVGLKKKDKLTRPLTPLEKIDLSQLKLVAVLRTESVSKAMVEDATGKGYVISIGTLMGTHSGKVIKIQKDRVFIEEETEDFLGRVKKTEREIRLQKPSGEE